MTVTRKSAASQATGEGCMRTAELDSRVILDGSHELDVAATTPEGEAVNDRICVLVNQQGQYKQPARRPMDYENAVDQWREKHGRHWNSRHAECQRK